MARMVATLASLLAAGCATLDAELPATPRLLPAAARSIVAQGFSEKSCYFPKVTVAMRSRSYTLRASGDGAADMHVVRLALDKPIEVARDNSLPGIAKEYLVLLPPTRGDRLAPGVKWCLNYSDEAEARRFMDAYNDLVLHARTAPDEEAEFVALAKQWRKRQPKPPLSSEGRRHKVLAENAFREKNVAAAIRHYEAALEADPTWPNGNYNLALLLAESGDYGEAARRMKRYLLLEPDARDARTAADKVIVWEEKAREG